MTSSSDSSDASAGSGKSRLPLAILIVAVVGIVAAAAVYFWPDPDGGEDDLTLPEARRREIYRDIDIAIAIMEGGDFTKGDEGLEGLAKAIQVFVDLQKELPDELLPVRNLAVIQALQFEAGDAELQRDRFEPAITAINQLLQREDDKRVAAILGARFLSQHKTIDPDERAKRTEQMLQQVPKFEDDSLAQYALYEAASAAISDEYQEVADRALRRAHEADPENLHILSELLRRQVQTRDEDFVATVRAARPIFETMRRTIELGQNHDNPAWSNNSLEEVDKAIAAAEAGEWPVAFATISVLLNVMRPTEAYTSDASSLDPHPLDFVLFRLSDEFREANPIPSPVEDPVPATWENSPLAMLKSIEQVSDLQQVDFDLDRDAEWVVLSQVGLTVIQEAGAEPMASVAIAANLRHLLVADLDYDELEAPPETRIDDQDYFQADPDCIIYGEDGVMVFENRRDADSGQRSLVSIPQSHGLDAVRGVRTAKLVDIDHDKDLDLICVTAAGFAVWLNRGNGDFLEATDWSRFPAVGDENVELFPVDWDRDADLDVVLVGESLGAGWLENMRHGQLVWRPFKELVSAESARSVTVMEADGNVSWDLAIASEQLIVALTASPAARRPQPLARHTVDSSAWQSVQSCDVNNDSAIDLVVADAKQLRVCYGQGDGTFTEAMEMGVTGKSLSRPNLVDINQDGWLDIVVVDGGTVSTYLNQPGEGHWLQLVAVGQQDNAGHAGHTGIGTLVEIMSGGRYQAQVVQAPTTHFGLGEAEQADVVRIVWTNGVPQSEIRPAKNQLLVEKMVLKGSCPYIYTWTEDGYQFFTDCLWAAPIGLQAADGVPAPSRSWEYLRIPGEALVEHEGCYRLLLTEELWEAAYFDHVRLLAIDHPQGTEIYSNEKVGPPTLADYQIHTVRQRRWPVAARDKHGRDVLDLISAEDERYFAGWDRRIRQGLTDKHFLELDLGRFELPTADGAPEQDASSPRITLFLRGWIYPTDTSWNVSLSQHPHLSRPQMPSIWVVDEQDQWVESIGFIGFPGGKTKTIAVDISDAFRKAGDYRLRVVTSGEICWDAAFFTVGEKPVEYREQPCPVLSAQLRYGGFSARLPARPHAPERYDFRVRRPEPRWPPMGGNFTRYGEVTSIVRDADDRMAVLGSGDEMEVYFSADIPEPPPGWQRDFILHCVGWDKDADLNTLQGATVEPLPYRDMPSYPYQAAGPFPDTAEIRQYLQTMQTRPADRMAFWRLLPQKYGRTQDAADVE